MSRFMTMGLGAALLGLLPLAGCGSSTDAPAGPSSPAPETSEVDGFRDTWVDRGDHRIHVREQPGDGPAILLLHGFPDNHHLYDRLAPELRGRHVVVFDFLGWGQSDKPQDWDYTFDNQTGDLDAVITGLGLDEVLLVPHDASGPAAFNWAVDHPDRVAGIVALNTFYSLAPGTPPIPPEAIRLFSDPDFARLTEHFADSPEQFRWLYDWQVGGFIQSDEVREQFVPVLYQQFEDEPSTVEPFLELNADLIDAVAANTARHPELARFTPPVVFAFGEGDPYLSPELGEALAGLFPNGDARTIAGAGHFPQLDAPTDVADVILDATR
jgi:pimeloyl-ACP methyl ester carboxylesterase